MINAVFTSSNEYVPFLLIVVTSFLEHNEKDFDWINIFILENKITVENKNRILDLTRKFSCNITFIQLDIFDSLNFEIDPMVLKSTVSIMTYARLFLSSLLPDSLNKVLYLDCDAIVLGSFKELWSINIEDYYCAGVIEPGANEVLKDSFWFYDVESYINGGMLLVNLEKWRTDNVEEKFITFLSNNQGKYFVADQGVINLVFDKKIKIVEPRYNLLFYFQYHDYDVSRKLFGLKGEYYSKEIVEDSKNNPVFVHFAGEGYSLPWHNKNNEYYSDFERYAKKTNNCQLIQFIESAPLKSKLFYSKNRFVSFLLKIIPASIVRHNIIRNQMAFLIEKNK